MLRSLGLPMTPIGSTRNRAKYVITVGWLDLDLLGSALTCWCFL